MGKHTELYDLLGVEPTATDDDIRKAYRKMALKYHPDKNRDNPEASKMFVRVKEAYDILSDSRKRAMYDSMGEESVKMMDNPTSATPEMFMTVIRSAPVSQRGKIMLFLITVILGFFWFVITLSLHIDNIIHWPWWTIMIPAYIVDAFILFMDILSIPSLYAKHRYNKDLEKQDRVPIYPDVLELLNSVLVIIVQITYPLRLDGILKCSYTMALLPLFIFGLKTLYMPIIYYKLKEIDFNTMLGEISSIIAYITVLLVCMKVDGFISWEWSSTFIFIWFYFGFLILKDLFFMCVTRLSGDMITSATMNSVICCDLFTVVIEIFIAVAVLNKISGAWKWKISTIVIIVMCIVGIIALCFLCTVYTILFGTITDEGMEEFVDVESQGNKHNTMNVETVEVDLGMD